jgi:hypothetical protein
MQIILAAPAGWAGRTGFMAVVLANAPGMGLPRLGDLHSVLARPAVESVRAELLECVPGMEGRTISRLYRLWAEYVVDHHVPRLTTSSCCGSGATTS